MSTFVGKTTLGVPILHKKLIEIKYHVFIYFAELEHLLKIEENCMKKMSYKYLTVLILAFPLVSNSASYPDAPTTIILHDSSGARNAIQLSCNLSADNRTLMCKFYQMSVSYKLEIDELQDSINAEIYKIKNEKDYLGKDPVKDIQKLCFSKSKDSEEINEHFNKMKSGSKKEYAEKMISIGNDACKAKTIKQVQDVMTKLIILDKEWNTVTCKVWPNIWEETFELQTTLESQYWLSKSKPAGECGIINISTIKKDDKYFWKYSSRRVVTNHEGNLGSLSCEKFEDRNVSYSWKQKEHSVNCKEIKFGF